MPARDLKFEIKNPCTADWNAMTGNEKIRFCEHCHLTVNNLSELKPKEVRRLVARSKGQLCVRYSSQSEQLARLRTVPHKLHQIQHRIARVAAGAFSATLTLSSAMAETGVDRTSYRHMVAYRQLGAGLEPAVAGGSIMGRVTDPNGAAIQGAGIVLSTMSNTYLLGTTTNEAGEFMFLGLPQGIYRLRVEAIGFISSYRGVVIVRENQTQTIETSLDIPVVEAEVEVNAPEVISVTVGSVRMVAAEPLIRAASDDDLEEVEKLLTRDNVNVRDKTLQTTALEHAVLNGNREMVQILLAAGADVNLLNTSKQTVLMMLSEETPAEIVWDLITAGAKVNLKDEDGDTALSEAASTRNLAVLMALIHSGAKVDDKNETGQTALMRAASNDQLANVRAVIRAGADMNARDKEGQTPLDYAIEENHERVIKLLQSYGAIATK
jgi:hypothetical protein